MGTTDNAPLFPYHSPELSRLIGIPDHPAIHLAISTVVDLLMTTAATTGEEPELQRVSAVRTASGAVLFSWPIEWAENFLLGGASPPHEVWWPEEALGAKRMDWLGQAIERLRQEGIDPGPDARRMRTRYGWSELV